ncbi:MAG: DUF4230 domain-containing protein [Treponema sp.]|nr:DUF4230 domain-containing protein [Treponema sp.]
MKKIIALNIFLAVLLVAGVFFMKQYVPQFFKNALLVNIPFANQFSQKIFDTYTSITGTKDEMKLVTAKKQFDFINIMDGKAGRYLEIATYEVRAGVDLEKPGKPVAEIFSSDKINSLVVRKEADVSSPRLYTDAIRPVNIAYEQKAKDYAVATGILKTAQEKAQDTLKQILGQETSVGVEDYTSVVPLSFVPLQLEIAGDYLSRNNVHVAKQSENHFFRDALVLESNGNEQWHIRFGDSGRTFGGTFDDFYQSVFAANTSKGEAGRDNVQIFRYFDPLYPKESEILSYASDRYRTFFILNEGRIFYIDAQTKSEQTLLDTLSPMMVYFASSLRKVSDRKIDAQSEYQSYTAHFFDVAESIRTNDSPRAFDAKVKSLLDTRLDTAGELTAEEKLISALRDEKSLERHSGSQSICRTEDTELNEINGLVLELKGNPEHFRTEEKREAAIRTATELSEKIRKNDHVNLALHQYLENYFLQNAARFGISEESRRQYEADLNASDIVIASRPLIALKTDSERNEYFYHLFRNRLSMSHFFADTSFKIDDVLTFSPRQNLAFAYFKLPPETKPTDSEVLEQLTKMNGGRKIDNAFILVFSQKEWDFGSFGSDTDIHALVLDDATLRLFMNIGSQNWGEKLASALSSVAKKFLRTDSTPEYFFYGDWKKLKITSDSVSIAGVSLKTKKITQKARNEYRTTNDYAEKSTIAAVLEDLQHAYSYDDTDFYYNRLCENIDNHIQQYVYKSIFRPSPRFAEDRSVDAMRRYNF